MKTFRRRRFVRRSTFRRRTYKRFTKPGTKRFFRKQRKWSKPEIKWMTNTVLGTTITPGNYYSQTCLPTTLSTGTTAENARIGRVIKSRKCMATLQMEPIATNPQTGSRPDSNIRIVFWTPVKVASTADSYMSGQTITSIFDWTVVNVKRDVIVRMSAPNFVIAGAGVVAGNAMQQVIRRFIIPHPRSIDFNLAADGPQIDANKDQLYMSVYNAGYTNMTLSGFFKTTFIDP